MGGGGGAWFSDFDHGLWACFNPILIAANGTNGLTMNPNDATKILFPQKVEHIIIDIGAADSDYLAAVEQRNDPTVALILVDPVPESLVPLIERVAKFNLLDPGNYTLLNRVFALRGAMAETEQSRVNCLSQFLHN